jgi:peroxiredoxin
MSRSSTDTGSRSSARTTGGDRLVPLTVAAVAAIIVGFAFFGGGADPADGDDGIATAASGYAFQVGDPGPGEPAPAIDVAATTGPFALDAHRGERVLLYFQEGLMCQPCWDQLTDIEARWSAFTELGIDRIATITTDELPSLEQKAEIEDITTPLVADPDRSISRTYTTLDYGMMGGSHNGHTFLVVGPDGTIEWRADYGGAPDYTMYMPVDAVLTDLEAGLDGTASS